jgi:Nuclease-related domain
MRLSGEPRRPTSSGKSRGVTYFLQMNGKLIDLSVITYVDASSHAAVANTKDHLLALMHGVLRRDQEEFVRWWVEYALIDQLGPNDLLIPGKRVTDHLKDHEIDFFVAIEGAGIACLEVEGGDVWHDGETWWQKRRGHEHKIDPVRQAREACYALRDFVESDPQWTQGRLRWDHLVVLPNAELPDDFALAECPRWKVIDRNDVPYVVAKLRAVLVKPGTRPPLAHPRRHPSAHNGVVRQGITATQRRRPRAGQRGRVRRAHRASDRHTRRDQTSQSRGDSWRRQRQDIPRDGAGSPPRPAREVRTCSAR